MQFVDILQGGPLRPDSVHYVTTGSIGTVEQTVSAHGNLTTSSFVLCALVCDTLCPPKGVDHDRFPPFFRIQKDVGGAVTHYNRLFDAFGIHPQDVFLCQADRLTAVCWAPCTGVFEWL